MEVTTAFVLSTSFGTDVGTRRRFLTTRQPKRKRNGYILQAKLRRSKVRVNTALQDVKVAWRRAGNIERLGLVAVATGVTTVVTATIMHASAAIALFAFSVLVIPAIMTLAAAFGAVALAAGAGTLGSLVILSPVFAVGSILKVAAEATVVVAVVGTILTKVGREEQEGKKGWSFPSSREEREMRDPYRERGELDDEDDYYRRKKVGRSWREEMFRSFDRTLHERQGGSVKGARWRRNFSELQTWSVDDVIDQLYSDGLGEFADLFDSERVDGAALIAMREADLRDELSGKVPLGMRVKLWRWIENMQAKYVGE